MFIFVPVFIVIVYVPIHVVEVLRSIVGAVPRNVINYSEEFGPWVIVACSTNNLVHVYSPKWIIQVTCWQWKEVKLPAITGCVF